METLKQLNVLSTTMKHWYDYLLWVRNCCSNKMNNYVVSNMFNLQAQLKEALFQYYAMMEMADAFRLCLKSGICQQKVIRAGI